MKYKYEYIQIVMYTVMFLANKQIVIDDKPL